ncbi:MAG: PepSY-like domain-containing protein [Bacteroidales bacterium]|nr:PepSY-like domain-containing protein [Candidatus Colimorpha onthohippi]
MKSRRIFLSFLLVILLCTVFLPTQAAEINPDRLPATAQRLIRRYFTGSIPIYAVREKGHYEVITNDNVSMFFDYRGRWLEIRCTEGISDAVLPVAIRIYVVRHFSHMPIIYVKHSRRGYKVGLANGLVLRFNAKCKFVGVE